MGCFSFNFCILKAYESVHIRGVPLRDAFGAPVGRAYVNDRDYILAFMTKLRFPYFHLIVSLHVACHWPALPTIDDDMYDITASGTGLEAIARALL